ncbi:MAG: prolyl oligopeptidase family serine peptidase [Bacteroidia bacterium]|nr:prolyl oligopeptidase family serine peptidase [Bacteroidia bacterium]
MTLANKLLLLGILVFLNTFSSFSQTTLTVESIMRDPAWIGSSPDNIHWSPDGKTLYFDWNPEQAPADSLYVLSPDNLKPAKVAFQAQKNLPSPNGSFSPDKSLMAYEKNGDIFILSLATGHIRPITNTTEEESDPQFDLYGKRLFFQKENNLFSWENETGLISQLTDFRSGTKANGEAEKKDPQQEWLSKQELSLMEVLRERKNQNQVTTEQNKRLSPDRPEPYFFGKKNLQALHISPDGNFVTFRLANSPAGVENTQVPAYIRESGYTQELRAYPKVGSPLTTYQSFLYDLKKDTVILLSPDSLPGVLQLPAFLAEYQKPTQSEKPKETQIVNITWSTTASSAVAEVRSLDFKDRWITRIDLATGKLINLDHQHDEAWIGGPGIPWFVGSATSGWYPDNQRFWFISEVSGYAHLYSVNVFSGEKKALTQGKFEVFTPQISHDGKFWYFTSSAVHPGERHFYRMPLEGGEAVQLTKMEGNNEVFLSPDEKHLAIRHSVGNRPWELFFQPNEPGAETKQITYSLTKEFQDYRWRKPEYITFTARDGAEVHARLYRPSRPKKGGAAVIFVHGAGYLQNAHKWWSSYFREYMFHNLLVDKGYTVLDIDYRASAGYGRDWRTAIYRHMGGKDLTDQIDGAKCLVNQQGINPKRIGIYGGSYGGFITLMAMFTEPDVFAAGAALRPVTDWSHYHHQYTAGILNSPQDDSIAYVRSSPIYHAEGLKGSLLICHGMIDTNVHFQDAVRLVQRLIELGKDKWELAVYPMESHAFEEASSWTDEYSRILKLFERELNGR